MHKKKVNAHKPKWQNPKKLTNADGDSIVFHPRGVATVYPTAKKTGKANVFGALSKKPNAIANAALTATYFVNNPYTDVDYQYFQDAWAHTIVGTAIEAAAAYTHGGGPKPTLELIDQSKFEDDEADPDNPDAVLVSKDEKIREFLKDYQYVIDKLVSIDNQPGVNLKQNYYDATIMAEVFGRCAIVKDAMDGKGIPHALKIIHPRDLGRVTIKDSDWTIESVVNLTGLTIDGTNIIDSEEMIYLVNAPNNPMRRNLLYGHSRVQRVVGAARGMRRFMEYDVPEIIEALWAPYGLFIMDPEGKQPSDVSAEQSTLLNQLNPGGFGVVSGTKEKLTFQQYSLNPNIEGLLKLLDSFERTMIGNTQIPAAMLGREEDTNMATLFGKIRLFSAGPVAKDREWLGGTLDQQWYGPLLQKLFPEEAKIIKIKTEFEPIIIESWVDTVQSLQQLKLVLPGLPDSVFLDLAGLGQYKTELMQNKINQEQKQKEMMNQQPPSGDENPEDPKNKVQKPGQTKQEANAKKRR